MSGRLVNALLEAGWAVPSPMRPQASQEVTQECTTEENPNTNAGQYHYSARFARLSRPNWPTLAWGSALDPIPTIGLILGR